MPNVRIQFNPDEATDGKLVTSSGLSDAAGKSTLKNADGQPGAVAGLHRVVLLDNNRNTEDEPAPHAKKIVNRVPPYAAATTTPLKVTIEPGKKSYDLKVGGRGR